MKVFERIALMAAIVTALCTRIVKASCLPGTYGRDDDCLICPPNYYCPGDTAEPFQCPPGYTSFDGEAECTEMTEDEINYRVMRQLFDCSNMPGYYCNSGATQCPDGNLCVGGGANIPCPAGQMCLKADEQEACPTGYYSNSGDQYCHICPAGSRCTSGSATTCSTSGTYSLQGETSCTACPAGYKCPNNNEAPERCPAGHYQTSGSQTSCNQCTAGNYCPSATSGPSGCSSGEYSADGATVCTPCPAGYTCPGRTSAAIAECPAGEYSPEGVETCTNCPADSFCPNKDSPHKCPEGTYSSLGVGTCTDCEVGYYCTGGVKTTCPHLTYSDITGMDECRRVPINYIIDNFVADGTNRTGGSSISRCGQNQYTDDMHWTCSDCDDAHQCAPSQEVVPCPFGHAKLDGNWYCSPCPPGSVCEISGTNGATTAVAIGTFLTANSVSASIPRFTAYMELGTRVCPPNNYCSNDGTNYHICPHGQYPMQSGCTNCAEGSFCLTSYHREETCTAGSVSAAGDSFPRHQPQGYVWNGYATGFTNEPKFTNVASNARGQSALGRIALTTTTNKPNCPQGYSCTSSNYARCPSTHLGETFAGEQVGILQETQEILHNYESTATVTKTKVAAGGVSTDVIQCLACNEGYSCSLGANPVQCAAGTYSPVAIPYCIVCPAGHYCEAKSAEPTPCAVNKYFANVGATQTSDCQDCPTGFYSHTGSDICWPCPAGHQCSSGAPVLCAQGQYSTEGEMTCSACQEGFACPAGSSIKTPPEAICPKGSYCALSGSAVLEVKCPAGKYGIGEGAISAADCIDCPVGYVCRIGTDDFTKYPCPTGNYCPTATSVPTQCPAGTFNPSTLGLSVASCQTCPAGYFCPIETTNPTICPAGSYCPSGTSSGTQFQCPAGTYSGSKTGSRLQSDCLPCTTGHYCDQGATTPTPAAEGYYIPYMGATSVNAAKKCPPGYPCTGTGNFDYKGFTCSKGHYCPPGSTTSTANQCPAGTYTDRTDLWDESQCSLCPAGYYCLAGSDSSGWTDCPLGYYCPVGTQNSTHYPCPTGTTGDTIKLKSDSECTNCTAGGGCGSGSSGSVTCAAGYYCPAGTTTSTPTEYRAPAGSYIPSTGATSQYDNEPCGLGKFCPIGSTAPQDCLAGTYSDILRAEVCPDCPAGYECPTITMTAPTPCAVGFYSASKATACTRCPEGHYCHQQATTQTEMTAQTCPAGTICSKDFTGTNYGLDVSPNLVDHKCPAGSYCEGGVASTLCPAGTYNPIPGRKALTDCLQTPAGFYTLAGATEYLSTPCAAGYYCHAGSTTATQNACPAGTFRGITGGRIPEDCGLCKSGFVCATEATVTPANCGQGNYCPLGTVIPELCPIGTYSAATNNPDSRSCTKCPAGHYCGSKGIITIVSTMECDSGFYCIEGATSPDPTDGITGMICPAGGYCLQGAVAVSACPTGQYNPAEGAKNASSCIDCTPGQYCAGSANPTPTGDCEAGYYCPAGASSSQQQNATAGHYAPTGSDFEIPCPRGTYAPSNNTVTCASCAAGEYCPTEGMTAADPCPVGHYCEGYDAQIAASKYYEARPCPVGTYNGFQSKVSLADCVACDAGKYCDEPGLSAPKGDCDAGFYCLSGSPFINPAFDDVSSNYGRCPMGKHCASATSVPTDCVLGQYSGMTKLVDNTYCKDCEPGYYCDTAGISAPTGPCDPGHFCAEGSSSATAAVCTAQNFCPQGSPNEERCPVGFYNTQTAQGNCVECEAGATCFDGQKADCPEGYYCP